MPDRLRCPFHDVPFRDATICPSCINDLERDLGDIPALVDELHVTLSRQARIDAAGGVVAEAGQEADEDRTCQHCYGRGRRYWQDTQPRCLECNGTGKIPVSIKIQPSPFNLNASDVAAKLHALLVSWVQDIHLDADPVWPDDETPALARWLHRRLEVIRQHPAADQIRDEIAFAVEATRRAVDRPPHREFAGPCLAHAGAGAEQCLHDLYAMPGAETVTCPDCRTAHDLAERRVWLLAAAEDHLATASQISQGVTGLGATVTAERIRKWAERGRVTAHSVDLDGRPLYRVGDVIELLAADRERASSRRSA